MGSVRLTDGVVINDSSNDEACLFRSPSFKATDQPASTGAHSLFGTSWLAGLMVACDSLCLDWLD